MKLKTVLEINQERNGIDTLVLDIPKKSIVQIHVFEVEEKLVSKYEFWKNLFSFRFIVLLLSLLLIIWVLLNHDEKFHNILSTITICVVTHDLYQMYKKAKNGQKND